LGLGWVALAFVALGLKLGGASALTTTTIEPTAGNRSEEYGFPGCAAMVVGTTLSRNTVACKKQLLTHWCDSDWG
jgi:hypothetical protein